MDGSASVALPLYATMIGMLSKTDELGFRAVNWGATLVNCSIHVPVLELTVVPEIEAYELASASGNLADMNPPFDPGYAI